ncbi:MAG: hypothetical protein IJY42_00990 [Clostridia bacterium]|nr:hypothetical protein [Clostridia bacterium]
MGKGSRNRQRHLDAKVETPLRYQQKKDTSKWVAPIICIVLVAAILIGLITSAVSNSGIIERNRVIIESQTGKFDVNQQIATFIAWQDLYSSSYTYYVYCMYGIYQDTYGLTTLFSSPEQYALAAAESNVADALRDTIDGVLEMLTVYVAVCDEAHREGVELDDEDLKTIDATIDQLRELQKAYGQTTLNAFLSTYIADGLRKSDVEKALKMIALYDKYSSMVQEGYESSIGLDDLVNFKNENPENYYQVDYIAFETENEEIAKQLIGATSEEEFKELALKAHLDDNYKDAFNRFTTLLTAEKELDTLSGKTDSNNSTAFTDALNKLEGVEAAKDYTPEDEFFTDKEDIKSWLFSSSRKQFNTDVFAVENGIYLVAFLSEKANTETVSARVKFYEFVEGDVYGEDAEFKKNIYAYIGEVQKAADLNADKKEDDEKTKPVLPTVSYLNAKAQAEAFKATVEAEEADAKGLFQEQDSYIYKSGITSSTSSTSTLPTVVIKAATDKDVKAGDIIMVNSIGDDEAVEKATEVEKNAATYYVIYVDSVASTKYNISYVTFKGEIYYQLINDLTTSLSKVYPTLVEGKYDPDAEEDTFEAWMSELTDKDAFTSARAEFDTQYFKNVDEEESESEEDEITYTAYMILNTPMYLNEELVVKGGFLEFADNEDNEMNYEEAAQKALEALKDKSELEIYAEMNTLGYATISSELTKEDLEEIHADLAAWFFDDARKAGETAIVKVLHKAEEEGEEDINSAYVVVFSEKVEQWKSAAKVDKVTQMMEEWADGLTESYEPNQKALDKLGEPTTTTEATTAETTAAIK